MGYVIRCANFGVNRLRGVGSAGSRKLTLPSEAFIAYNNLPCTTMQG
jgi:hypothetical protein